ncbi:thiamine phosphate synthase [Mucilaginibacter sp. RS28]|uniref:Thiamine phosphate synthase n=1 Tax=Mucilaginibacter straminoryzae TaxID=2932774 RepID=A0A9X1X5J4_9SPHI|nr:thiamine phosphate synthase [Mucilaginibacter straminoryzae]MCJ8211343.1 thiamine phosphate synthase [Mucilaginibacter straminoryzae]
MMKSKKIDGGVYLVIDPGMQADELLFKLEQALKAGLAAVQIWNNWALDTDKLQLVAGVGRLCEVHRTPLIIDNDWELMLRCPELDGVHFDNIPPDYAEIRKKISKPFLAGITCSGNLDVVQWAHDQQLDYISFCAMFPSASAGSCTIVMPETVTKARKLTGMPIFVSGGITPDNIYSLRQRAPFNGVAVISGIMSAVEPQTKVKLYQKALDETTNHC